MTLTATTRASMQRQELTVRGAQGTAKELVEPLTAVAIPSDQVTTTFAFSGTLAALGAGSRVPIIGGVESTSKGVEELVP